MNRRKRSRVNPEGYSDKYDNSPRYSIDYFSDTPPDPAAYKRYAAQIALYADLYDKGMPDMFVAKPAAALEGEQ